VCFLYIIFLPIITKDYPSIVRIIFQAEQGKLLKTMTKKTIDGWPVGEHQFKENYSHH
jgi:hypothetical protein